MSSILNIELIVACNFQGNKGGVSIRMDIAGVNICFVNSHLAAHLDNVPERIQVFSATTILSQMKLSLHVYLETNANM